MLFLDVNRKRNKKCKCSTTIMLMVQSIDMVRCSKNLNERQKERKNEYRWIFFSAICLQVIARSYFLHLLRSFPLFILLSLSNCGQKGILALRNTTSISYSSSSLFLIIFFLCRVAAKKRMGWHYHKARIYTSNRLIQLLL